MENLVLKKQWFINNKPGSITDYYQFESKPIGSGAFGTVLKGRLKGQTSQGAWRAVKRIAKKKVTDKVEFINEIEILSKLDHPNIIKLYQTFEDQRHIYMITEMCTGGELFDKIIEKGFFTEQQARVIFKQMMLALNYCHAQGVAHRDLKPENFLFLNKEKDAPIKLIDFGLSVKFAKDEKEKEKEKKTSMKTFVGTSYYMAPQVMKGLYNQNCDVWSSGVILYILVTGIPPFNGESDDDILKAVKKMTFTFDIPEMANISVSLKNLITKMLVSSPQRPTAEDVLNNEWVKKGASTEPLPINIARMKSFSTYSKLKKIAVMMIATQINQHDIRELGKVFQSIDKNQDGELTLNEIRTALLNQKDKPGMMEVQKILKDLDIDGSGSINYTEFTTACMSHALIQKEENVHMAFKMMDRDQSGTISKEEMKKILAQPEHHYSETLVDSIIKECDKNGDGVIDYNEFLDTMAKAI